MEGYKNQKFNLLANKLNLPFIASFSDAKIDSNSIKVVKNSNTNEERLEVTLTLLSIPSLEDLRTLTVAAIKERVNFKFKYDNNEYLSSPLVLNYLEYVVKKTLPDNSGIARVLRFKNVNYDEETGKYLAHIFDYQNTPEFQEELKAVNKYMKELFGFDAFELNVKVNTFDLKEQINNNILQNYDKIKNQFSDHETVSTSSKKGSISYDKGSWGKRRSPSSYTKYTIQEVHELPYEDETTNVSVTGYVYKTDVRDTNKGLKIHNISITDYNDAISTVFFERENTKDVYVPKIGDTVEAMGRVSNPYGSTYNGVDKYNKQITVNSFSKVDPLTEEQEDLAYEKRVELSTRTKMSTMDGLLNAEDIVSIVKQYGHSAVAIVDSNGVQSYPTFEKAAKKAGIKPIYGVSFDVISKNPNFLLNYSPDKNAVLEQTEFVVLDIETTHLSAQTGELIEFGAQIVKEHNAFNHKDLQFFIKAQKPLSAKTMSLTNITQKMLDEEGIELNEALDKIYDLLNNKVCVAHNANFDFNFIIQKFIEQGKKVPNTFFVDTLNISRLLFPEKRSHTLGNYCSYLQVSYDSAVAHRADYDAGVLASAWIKSIQMLKEKGILTFDDLYNTYEPNVYSHVRSNQISVLAKNQQGIKEISKLITLSLTERFFKSPKLFMEDIKKTENILIGSGGLKSRFIDNIFYSSDIEIQKSAEFADYIEIPHPNALKHYLEPQEKFTQEEIYDGIKRMINWANKLDKIPVAIGDVRYKNKLDKEVFRCLVYSKGIGNSSHFLFDHRKVEFEGRNFLLPDLEFYTTDQMLESFKFLNDEQLINDLVIVNTNKIANLIDPEIKIVHDKLYTPKFDDSAVKLKELVYKTAHERYGEVLPQMIEERLQKEITPILKYGFDVIYWISHILVKKSLESGYLVGSRGSVGSSLVATFAGITEVNPLPAHYICPNCKNFVLNEDSNITSGFDLDDKNCDKCGTLMNKDGHTIPFETFLGFDADKVPDIDLNFAGDFQPIIHNEVKKLFGDSHTLRAGTISTIQSKTAFGYVKKANEEYNLGYSNAFVDYLSSKLEDIKRTTGQHPGGILIIPKEFDVEDFTPVNYPADDTSIDWKTTHFDYRAIHDNVLKLDLLGHIDPMAIRMLEKLTGLDVKKDIPKKDKRVMSLFSTTKELNITPEQIGGEPTGALGIPEFGTSFVRKMLIEAQPESFADLISISGLSHGTDVWTGNAQSLIKDMGLSLKDVISCRDDMMEYLMKKNIESKLAFKVMEQVRKGKGVTEEQVAILKKNNVPSWYIDSMQKIKYMFPKAHATAYVLMAWRIAWFKLYKPLEYYATFFTTRATEFDLHVMMNDFKIEKINKKIKEITLMNDRKVKDDQLLQTLELAREMYARGLSISNISLTKSLATEWVIDYEHNALIPPFTVVGGLGEAVANEIVNARNESEFVSKEDFRKRGRVNQTLYKILNEEFKVLDELNETNQLTLF
ncbi:PolC-type DNA polymerase III [Mycoplasma sp. 4079]|uniref:PolC-type DNA polymerase III n=1 Tax=Mycoplasma sp. 4079 TaxID=3398615 RepID=UPI0039FBFB8A